MGTVTKSPPAVWWIDSEDEGTAFHGEAIAWVETLGLNPSNLAPKAAVIFHDGHYELHVDEFVPEFRDGRIGFRYDPLNEDELLAVRRIIAVVEGSWPARPSEVTV